MIEEENSQIIDSFSFIAAHFAKQLKIKNMNNRDILTVVIMLMGRAISDCVALENWPKVFKATEQYAIDCAEIESKSVRVTH